MEENDNTIEMIDLSKYSCIYMKNHKVIYRKDTDEFTLQKEEESFTLNTNENIDTIANNAEIVTLFYESLFKLFQNKEGPRETILKFFKKANEYLLKLKDNEKHRDKIKNNDFFKENEYPRWFSCFGGLNFDYDYCLEDIDGNKSYYNSFFLYEIETRNNNGWIVKNGWIDKVCDFFSNLNCRKCNNKEPEINGEIMYSFQQNEQEEHSSISSV